MIQLVRLPLRLSVGADAVIGKTMSLTIYYFPKCGSKKFILPAILFLRRFKIFPPVEMPFRHALQPSISKSQRHQYVSRTSTVFSRLNPEIPAVLLKNSINHNIFTLIL
jgi:hypothetical protein